MTQQPRASPLSASYVIPQAFFSKMGEEIAGSWTTSPTSERGPMRDAYDQERSGR